MGCPYSFECSAVSVKTGNNIIIVSIYRSPSGNTSVDIFFEKLIILVAGDFNIHTEPTSNDSNKSTFLSIVESFDATLVIKSPTRNRACIDNIITNIENVSGYTEQAHVSDHLAQIVTFQHKSTLRYESFYIRPINESNLSQFGIQLSQYTWEELYTISPENVDLQWEKFMQIYKNEFEHFFPTKKITTSNKSKYTPCRDPKLRKLKELLDITYIVSGCDCAFKESYRKLKLKYDFILKRSRQEYYYTRYIHSDNKSKEIWNIIRERTGKQAKKSRLGVIGSPQTVVNDFNIHFRGSQIPQPIVSSPVSNKSMRIEKSFYMFDVTEEEVLQVVKRLANKKCCGQDEIPMKVIKQSINFIIKPLVHIIDNSFKYGIFPKMLKIAVIKPIYKKNDPSDISNYRPISLLNNFAKIFEKIMCNRLLSFFKKFKIFSEQQHGFTEGKSTETALYTLTQMIYEGLEDNDMLLGFFLDFSKAFDSVNHVLLIKKLETYGIRGIQLQLFRSYLHERTQYVSITVEGQEYMSEISKIIEGVPQGSHLGPILFLIYTNEMPNIMPSIRENFVNYADDTNILLRAKGHRDLQNILDTAATSMSLWCESHNLKLNTEKTEFILFSHKLRKTEVPESLQFLDEEIQLKYCTKFLGVTVDQHLNWFEHIQQLCKSLNKVLYTLRVLKSEFKVDFLKTIYYSNFQALMSYGLLIWGSSQESNCVFRIQKLAMRCIFNLKFRETCRGIFRENNILTLPALYIYKCLQFIFKQPQYFRKFNKTSCHNTRHNFLFYPRHYLVSTEKSPTYMCIKLFNSLPVHIREIGDFKLFRKEIYRLLLHQEPYNITEFLSGLN